jgi:hypothetical protein
MHAMKPVDLLRETIEAESKPNPFAAKVGGFPANCAALAANMLGVSVPTLAIAFGVSERTMYKLTKGKEAYSRAHEECAVLGAEAFSEKYLTEYWIEAINEASRRRRTKEVFEPTAPDHSCNSHDGRSGLSKDGKEFKVVWAAIFPEGEAIEGWFPQFKGFGCIGRDVPDLNYAPPYFTSEQAFTAGKNIDFDDM